jgi:hypothetical protein
MRRRFALPALLALAILLAPATALADDGAAASGADGGVLLLAVEEGEPVGPDPMPRTDENNPAGEIYADMPTPFTWGAAWLLTLAGLAGVTVLTLIWVLLVRRPEREREEAGRT